MVYIVFIISAIVIVTVAAVLAPMGVLFNTEAYKMGENIFQQANGSIGSIQNANARANITYAITSALDSQEINIEANAALFQYSWLFVIGLSAIILFIFTRQMVEYGSQSGGFV